MWLSIAACSSFAGSAATQSGSAWCQSRAWSLDLHPVGGGEAHDRVRAGEAEDAGWRSVGSHFISYSA
jgi:hypothetical protein